MTDDVSKIARRVCVRYLTSSSSTEMSAVYQKGTSQARLSLNKLQEMLDRAISLIDASPDKESIYAQAGDLISAIPEHMRSLQEALDILAFASSKIDEKKLKNRIPIGVREQIELAVKRDI